MREGGEGDRLMERDEVIARLGLQPLEQEGGWFKRIYTGESNKAGRSTCTTILALFTADVFSALHSLDADEQLFYSGGDPFRVFQIASDRTARDWVLGPNLERGQYPSVLMRKGSWFGGKPVSEGRFGWSMISAVVTPGFEWEGFELGSRAELLKAYPEMGVKINEFTR